MKPMNRFTRICKALCASTVLVLFTGCAATNTLLSKKDLDVQTQTSTSIFVEPVAPEKRTIYLDVKSGVMEFDRSAFKSAVADQFAANDNGFRIIDDPEKAQFTMIAYVLNFEKASPTAAQAALGQGYYGGGRGGAMAGAAVGYATGGGSRFKNAAGGAVVGGAADFISGALVKDITYMLVCDLQIKEKTKDGVVVTRDTNIQENVSNNGATTQTYSEQSDKKEYRTRIVTTANKANLKLEEAQPAMMAKTAFAMSGFF